MIKNISINNFKSIKQLDFKAKRVNVFIGEPNTGKSNILEALGMFLLYHSKNGDIPIRYQEADNLFYDNESFDELTVSTDCYSYEVKSDTLRGFLQKETEGKRELFAFDLINRKFGGRLSLDESFPIKFYQFKVLEEYKGHDEFLLPPTVITYLIFY